MATRRPEKRTKSRRSRATPRELEGSYQLLFEKNPHPMWVYDLETLAFLAVNDAAIEHYGYSRDEFLGMTIKDIRPPADVPALLANVARVTEGLDNAGVWRHCKKDGTIIDAEIVSHTMTFAGRRAELVLAHDVTARERDAKALQGSQARLRMLAEAAFEGIALTEGGLVVDINDQLARMLGGTREDFLGRPVIASVAPESRALVAAALADGRVEPYEHLALRRDGSVFSVEIQARAAEIGGRRFRVTAVRDISERKRLEASMRETHQRLRAVIDASPAGIVLLDANGIVQLWSHGAARLLGWTADEIVGRTLPTIPAGKENEHQKTLDLGRRGEAISGLEIRRQHKDGSLIDLNLWTQTLHDADGACSGVLGVMVDATERKRAERSLRESEERLRLALLAAHQGLYDLNVQTGDAVVNEDYARMLGHDPATFRESNAAWLDRLHPEDRERCATMYRSYIAGANPTYQVEFRQRTASGEWKWILSTGKVVEWDPSGKPLRMLGTHLDITERKQVEEALLRSETRYRHFSELTSDYVYSCTRAEGEPYRVDWVGGAFERISGYTVEHLLRLGCWLPLVHPEDRERVNRYLLDLAPGQSETCEFRLVAADGSVRWIQERSRCVPHEDRPQWYRLYGTSRDTTAQKRAEEERVRLEEQMRHAQKLESLGVMAGGIAHDFNNLLMAILGNADLALLRMAPESPARSNVDDIGQAARQAADLCRQMLAYAGRGRFVVEKLDLSAVVREMVHILQVSISKKAALRYDFADRLPAVEADAAQVRQVVMNLITNASEALGEQSGFISIATGSQTCDRTYLTGSILGADAAEGLYAFLEVSDTGCGMDAAALERIFDPFFSTKFAGRGLGLAAVLGIVRGHNGVLRVYSEPGKGSTFKVLLPAAGQLPAREERGPSTAVWRGTGTILLVDDEEMARTTAQEMLEWLGFAVVTAADGQQAIEMFRSLAETVRCVLLDLTMPRVGGEEAFRELRRIRPDVPVILCSGYNEQDVTQRFVGRGLAGFVQKPYTVAMLQEALRRVLG